MNLSISNIAWNSKDNLNAINLIKKYNFNSIEIAPTKFLTDPYENPGIFIDFSEKNQLKFCSIQSACFGISSNIFKNEDEAKHLLEHLSKVIIFSDKIGCRNLVFGCPKNRNVENLESDYKNQAINFFSKLDLLASINNINIALEPNPIIYGTNFLNYTRDVFNFIKENDFKNIKINLDLGTIIYNKEDLQDIREYIDLVNHIHISEPNLELILERDVHYQLFKLLNDLKYDKFVSVEMKETSLDNINSVLGYLSKINENF